MSGLSFRILSVFAALLVVLVLIRLAARAAQRFGLAPRSGAGRRLTLAETLPLDPRRRVHLIRCDSHEILLLTGGGRDVVIGWLVRPETES